MDYSPPYRQGHDISHTHTLLVAFHLRLAARLDTWLDSSLLCLSTPHMLWTRGENTLQGSGVHATKPQPSSHSSSITPTPHWYNPVQMLLIKGEKQWNHLLNVITVSLNHTAFPPYLKNSITLCMQVPNYIKITFNYSSYVASRRSNIFTWGKVWLNVFMKDEPKLCWQTNASRFVS